VVSPRDAFWRLAHTDSAEPAHLKRSAPLLMLGASLLFALMGAGVKLASATYGAGEIVFFRAAVGLLVMGAVLRLRDIPAATPVPAMHFWRSLCGATALCLWFYAIGGLPLGTAVTLNYMSSVWIALFLIGGAALLAAPGSQNSIDGRLVASVLAGFAGVALVLRPTLAQDQLWHGLCGLLSGMLAAMAYLQVSALGRAGEPEERVVFYFSLGGMLAGLGVAWVSSGSLEALTRHTAYGLALLVGIGLLATGAQWMLTRAYAIGNALANSALHYTGIVFSFALGVWLFDDPVTLQALAGMALIIVAGLSSTMLRSKLVRSHTPANDT
jgi:S-adenosylmethionine uptake transporter